ncbi:hypothetical protein LCGC14_2570260, partial [marine sediment metagenome]
MIEFCFGMNIKDRVKIKIFFLIFLLLVLTHPWERMGELLVLNGKQYLLFLIHIDENRMDYGGNLIPEKGFVKSNNFTYDKDIRYGLFGIPWGKTLNFLYEDIN